MKFLVFSFEFLEARIVGVPGFLLKTQNAKRKTNHGFTLIELLVVTAIIVIVSAVVLANQNKFGGQVLLQNFAYDVALSIRQAQVYGLAVKGATTTSNIIFPTAYGIHFDIAKPTTYDLFADRIQKNGIEDTGENVQTMNIRRGYSISSLCINGVLPCNADSIDIIFQRPEPDALISWKNSSSGSHNCLGSSAECATFAKVVLTSPRGDTMSVTVNNNGQITVVKP